MRILLAAVAFLILSIAAATVPIKQVESRIDPVTGSIRWTTVWFFGLTPTSRTDVSPLESRLKISGIPWTPSWQLLHITPRTAFSRATRYDCGIAPPIYEIRPILGQLSANSSDAELRAFVQAMQGPKPAQTTAVEEAAEKILSTLFTDRGAK